MFTVESKTRTNALILHTFMGKQPQVADLTVES